MLSDVAYLRFVPRSGVEGVLEMIHSAIIPFPKVESRLSTRVQFATSFITDDKSLRLLRRDRGRNIISARLKIASRDPCPLRPVTSLGASLGPAVRPKNSRKIDGTLLSHFD
jgi:hypothetical protein